MIKNKIEKTEIKTYCRKAGIALIILGLAHFIFSNVLDSSWSFPLIAVGIYSLIFYKRSTLLIFGISLVLVGTLNILPLVLEGEEVKWAFLGALQIYWGITEFLKFRRMKGKVVEKNIKPIFQILSYIVLFAVFIFYIYGYLTSYSLYKTVNGEEIIVDVRDCELPYMELGYRCCIPSENYTFMCDDEATDYEKKFEESDDAEKMSIKERITNKELGISFVSPEEYAIITNTKEGGIDVPYTFATSGVDDNGNYSGDTLLIGIYSYKKIYTTENQWDDFMDSIYSEYDELQEETTENGYEIIFFEDTGRIENESDIFFWYSKDVFFKDKEIQISLYTTEGLKSYAGEFEEIIDSLEFEES